MSNFGVFGINEPFSRALNLEDDSIGDDYASDLP